MYMDEKEPIEVNEDTAVTEKHHKEKKPKKEKNKISKKGKYPFLHIIMHLSIVMAVILGVSCLARMTVGIDTIDGYRAVNLGDVDSSVSYEDSVVFNDYLGSNISNIICYGAIRGQMETDAHFDGQKAVDVTAFNRRYDGVPDEYITARYALEDLIKWGQNGFNYETVYMTGEEADEFLSKTYMLTIVEKQTGKGMDITGYTDDGASSTMYSTVSGDLWEEDGAVREDTTATTLKNRYKTLEGKNIEEYVSSWEDYYNLCNEVEMAANDLLINYNEYVKYQDFYAEKATNLKYCIRKTVGNEIEIYTNVPEISANTKDIAQQMEKICEKYIYYNPLEMTYETNTLIEEDTLRYIVNGYEYAYPENTQIWIGVDTNYLVNDGFLQEKKAYDDYVPYYWQLIVGACAAFLLYLLLLVFLTMKEGYRVDNEGTVSVYLHTEDKIYTEIMAAIGAGIAVGILFAIYEAGKNLSIDIIYSEAFVQIAGAIALVISLLFSFFYFSLVRRIKARSLWRDSLLKRLYHFVKRVVLQAYDNSAVLLRVGVPIVALIAVTLIMGRSWSRWNVLVVIGMYLLAGAFLFYSAISRKKVLDGINRIKGGDTKYQIDEKSLHGDNLVLAQAVNQIGEGIRLAVETSMKDERMKTDLITNVSHDIKTPITSIINYVDLIKRENVDNERVREYVEILESKSQRLKQLTDDLVEASKISSGTISLQMERINLVELVNQTIGEFSEKFEERQLQPVLHTSENAMYIEADSRRIWRVIENLFNNIYKYALGGTRVYIDMEGQQEQEKQCIVTLSIKNISAQPLNINPDDLVERFIRGDEARTTEGSGLGLSIAKSLTEAQNGQFEIILDGDLFKVVLTFPLLK